MEALSAREVLLAWEQGLHAGPLQRALQILSLRSSEQPLEALASLSIGQRDAALLDLHAATFGRQVIGKVVCPLCGEPLELTLDVDDLRRPPALSSLDVNLELADYQVRLHLPNSLDLAIAADAPDLDAGRQSLLERCLLSAKHNGEKVTELPDCVLQAITERLAEADPQADLHLNVTCCGCTHNWQVTFDIVSFLWTEIEAWAMRLVHEVHALASAYGWSEHDILAMSSTRRQMYLEMVAA
ncbi:MAG: hypothetical protein WA655_01945 [Candidatus Korobacteraceae bacterium]